MPVALVAAAGYAASGNPGPLLVALFSGAASTSAWRLAALAGIGLVGFLAPDWPGHGWPAASQIAFAATGTLGVMASGGYVARQRQLTVALRERAELAEAARRLQDDRTRVAERTRIAREMHDVLGHKVALICLHAGGLEVNAGAGAARVEQGAALIRATAQETLAEMRAILGVLRPEDDGPDAEGADPQFPDLHRLVDSWVKAGATVALHDEVGAMPPATARAVHRLVQEGLTNAHKHATGAAATVTLTGGPGDGVTAVISNGPPDPSAGPGPGAVLPGGGAGLVGLVERLRLLGGTVRCGPDGAGGWRLEGRLPWPAGQSDPTPGGPA